MKTTFAVMKSLAPLVAAWVVPGVAAALGVGDPAPKLEVGRWLQGDAVKEFEGDKVYLVEFWATWCGPCVASIPHLNELHERYRAKGLVVIGQNVFERDDSRVPAFVQGMAGKMGYRVALDDKSDGGRGRMAQNWLAAAGQNGIPCAFVIDKRGRIAAIGHPMSLKEETLEALLAAPSAVPPPAPPGEAPDQAGAPSAKALELARRAEAEIRAGSLDQAEATIAELAGALGEKRRDIGGLLELDLLLVRRQAEDALQLAKLMCEDFSKQPAVRSAVAARLVAREDSTAALQAAAERIVTPISEAAGEAQAPALATLARIAFLRGDKDRAAELQDQAVALSAGADATARKADLEAYRQGRLPADGGVLKGR
jgi:thiol-disulfide isomerase/thioredoxin